MLQEYCTLRSVCTHCGNPKHPRFWDSEGKGSSRAEARRCFMCGAEHCGARDCGGFRTVWDLSTPAGCSTETLEARSTETLSDDSLRLSACSSCILALDGSCLSLKTNRCAAFLWPSSDGHPTLFLSTDGGRLKARRSSGDQMVVEGGGRQTLKLRVREQDLHKPYPNASIQVELTQSSVAEVARSIEELNDEPVELRFSRKVEDGTWIYRLDRSRMELQLIEAPERLRASTNYTLQDRSNRRFLCEQVRLPFRVPSLVETIAGCIRRNLEPVLPALRRAQEEGLSRVLPVELFELLSLRPTNVVICRTAKGRVLRYDDISSVLASL